MKFFTKRRELTLKERTIEGFGVVIELPRAITRDEAERWREEWMRRHASEPTR